MPSRPGSPYNTQKYRTMKARYFASVPPICQWQRCPIPGRYVDMSLSGNHPWGPTVDHRQPTSRGGAMWDTTNWRLLHRRCNGSKGNRTDRPTRTRTALTW